MSKLYVIDESNLRMLYYFGFMDCMNGRCNMPASGLARIEYEELGSGTLTAEQVRECVQPVYMEGYSDGSVNRGAHIDETDWQAIADELNAELGSGTCENDWAEFGKFRCSECGLQVDSISTGTTAPIPIAFCPRCGRKVNRLTISDDGTLLNWRGENYVKQSTLGGGVCKNVSDPPEGFLCSECGWGDFNEPSHMLMTAKFTNNDRGPNYCPNCGSKVER